ncbi:sigma-70 family RNA polymerase sigma factor [Planctomonas psychrotolerans]|uniref:sigma-70 family RNA polymerase sigma factor n=1 Tax=Planctomonas psychrotolerans TaxID=2528712 RepID=UPI00123A7DF3|nr:sigma-70 family RNA polymerase sigma factor [Planctomonas psychrotolerans]
MTLAGDAPAATAAPDGDVVLRFGPGEDDDIESRAGGIAGASTDAVKDYLRQLSKVPLLTAEEEVSLAKRIEAGVLAQERLDTDADLADELRGNLTWLAHDGKVAKEALVRANLRLVVSIAKRYAGRGMHFMDVIQEGNIGLVRAVEKFDFTTGFKFSTYGSWWIRQSITRALANQARTIRIPVHTVEAINKIAHVEAELRTESGREPTMREVAAGASLSVDVVNTLRAQGRDPISLHIALGDDVTGGELGDVVEDANATEPLDLVADAMMNQHVSSLIDSLPARDRDIITMRFGLDGAHTRTYEQIGTIHGVTRERIRQLEAKILVHLRQRADRGYLED